MHKRLSQYLRFAMAMAFAISSFAFVSFASAQTCPYNSTQGTCACPTSGGGTTCFGGLEYRSTDSTCQSDSRPCAANQLYNCASLSCSCNTASYPCGGCSAATSTVGAACASTVGATYVDQCSTCACPAGTTMCSSANKCVANRVCPAGSTWDVCSDTCLNPYVLISPGALQSGYINVSGDIKSTGGDAYLSSGKAVRIDGPGVTQLNVGNWGSGAAGLSMNVFGSVFTNGNGLSTFASDVAVGPGVIETSQLCLGNGTNCRTAWPSTADFDPSYVNVTGDTMTGPLALNTAGRALSLGGATGAVGDSRLQISAASSNEALHIVSASNWSPLTIRESTNTTDIFRIDQNGVLQVGNVPWARLSGFPAACPSGQFATTVGTTLTCATPAMTGLLLSSGAGVGKILTSDAVGNGTWQAPAAAPVTSVSGSGAGVSVVPTTGAVVVSNTGVTSAVAGMDIALSGGTGAVTINDASTLQSVTDRGSLTTNGLTVTAPVIGVNASGAAEGVVAHGGNYGVLADGVNGVEGISTSAGSYGIMGFSQVDPVSGTGVYGNGHGTGVYGTGGSTGVFGSGSTYGLYGQGVSYGAYGTGGIYGVWGNSTLAGSDGVYGSGPSAGVEGLSNYGFGGKFTSTAANGIGVQATGPNYGISASSPSGAGYFANTSAAGTSAFLAYGSYSFLGLGTLYNSGTGIFQGNLSTGATLTGGAIVSNSTISTLSLTTNGDVNVNNGWVRVSGNQGLFFQSYGGGWFMADGTWIRSFGSKPVYMDTGFDTGAGSGVGCYGGLGAGYTMRVCGTLDVTSYIWDSGPVYATGYYSSSDRRVKENVNPFTDGLDTLEKINPVNYTYNGLGETVKGHHGVGVIAQELDKVAPYAVTTRKGKLHPDDQTDTDIYAVDPSSLIFVNINAIKEVNAKVDAKDAKISELEARISALEAKLGK